VFNIPVVFQIAMRSKLCCHDVNKKRIDSQVTLLNRKKTNALQLCYTGG